MMYPCTTALVCAAVLIAARLEAEMPPLTPQQAVDRALATHPEVSLAGLTVEAARGARRAAGQLPNPALNYRLETLDRAGADAGEWTLDASWSLDEFWRRGPRMRVAAAHVAGARADDAQIRSDVRLRVLTAYTEAFAAAGQARTLSDAAGTLEEVVRIGRSRLREGDLSEYDVRRMELESRRVARAAQQARFRETDARGRLALHLGADPDSLQGSSLQASYPLSPPTAPLPSLVDRALRTRPDVHRSIAATDAGRADVARLKRERWPALHAGLGYKDEKGGASGMTGMVSVDLPLFDRAQGELQQARALARHAEVQAEWTRTRVEREVMSLRARLLSLHEQLRGLPAERDLMDLLSIARQTYDEGDSDLITLIDAVSSLTSEAQLRWSLLQEYQITYYELERAIGVTEAANRMETE